MQTQKLEIEYFINAHDRLAVAFWRVPGRVETMGTYTTSLGRAAMGLAAGTLTGAALIALWSMVGANAVDAVLLRGAVVVFVYAAVIWAMGLIVVAVVPWSILHRYEYRSWPVAVGLGAILTFIVVSGFLTNGFGAYTGSGGLSVADSGGPTWVNGHLTSYGWRQALSFAAICSVAGAIVGFVVWRTAYRTADMEEH